MAKFCDCCGQPLPGSEDRVTLFNQKLTILQNGLLWDGGQCSLTKSEAMVCMAIARCYPRPASVNFVMDFLENCQSLAFQADDGKIIDVFVCKIRRKMLNAGCPFHIETTWGLGKQFAEGAANGPIITASDYPRDQWKAERHAVGS